MESHKKVPEFNWIQGSLLGLTHSLMGLLHELRNRGLIDPKSFETAIKDFEHMTVTVKATEASKEDQLLDPRTLEVMHAVQKLATITATFGKDPMLSSLSNSIASDNEKTKAEAEAEGNNES
ncbi:hypothetical protein [Comamonas sp. 17RB]|uniref:hypothetical protein n=1 Tax=Comamonas sp. 17RB TaxID=3047025 RepID=UPI0024B6BE90|nr:hypothetical protein [Comamonas sp. 17RB]MDI9855217.1 hypothetical protein [Comamonas sp. 17RB]